MNNTLAASHKVRRYRCSVSLAVLAAAGFSAWSAPVVVTPGTLAGSVYSRQDPPTTAASGSSGPVERMNTCIVTPTADDKTLVMSTRNWSGRTTPLTVFYKMVGGGAGTSTLYGSVYPQFASAGGSSAILKNGALVAAASGMNGGGTTRNIVSGSFNLTSTDTIRFVAGGGGGSAVVAYQYGYSGYTYYGYSGGGGAGYYGGGSGTTYSGTGPTAGAPVAYGGTGTAGGAGGGTAGSLNYGGSTSGGGYPGGYSYGSYIVSFWSGYGNMYYQVGAGGNKGMPGVPGGPIAGYLSYCDPPPGVPASMPLETTYDLDANSGMPAFQYSCYSGGGRGEIVLKYQAAACDLIPNYNAP